MRSFSFGVLALTLVLSNSACRRSTTSNTPTPTPTTPTATPTPTTTAGGPGTSPGSTAGNQPTGTAVANTGTAANVAVSGAETTRAGALAITTDKPLLFRYGDGTLGLRIVASVQNTGSEPAQLNLDSFRIENYGGSGEFTTFPASTSLLPGMTVQGEMFFYQSTTEIPTAATLQYQPNGEAPPVWSRALVPQYSPAPPAVGAQPTHRVFSLPVTFTNITTFANEGDNNRHVRAQVTVTNSLDCAIRIPRAYFTAKIGEAEGNRGARGTTIPEVLEIAPGAQGGGFAAWYWNETTPAPTTVTFTYGPANSPQYNATLPVTAGPVPPE